MFIKQKEALEYAEALVAQQLSKSQHLDDIRKLQEKEFQRAQSIREQQDIGKKIQKMKIENNPPINEDPILHSLQKSQSREQQSQPSKPMGLRGGLPKPGTDTFDNDDNDGIDAQIPQQPSLNNKSSLPKPPPRNNNNTNNLFGAQNQNLFGAAPPSSSSQPMPMVSFFLVVFFFCWMWVLCVSQCVCVCVCVCMCVCVFFFVFAFFLR